MINTCKVLTELETTTLLIGILTIPVMQIFVMKHGNRHEVHDLRKWHNSMLSYVSVSVPDTRVWYRDMPNVKWFSSSWLD
jgi:hypothetical protein